MAEFRTVAKVGDLADGAGKTIVLGSKLVALFRQGDQYLAVDDTCPHMGASLSDGYVENGIVTCPWHAWRFRLADGAWADNLRSQLRIPCYPVQVVGDEIRIAPSPTKEERDKPPGVADGA